jgi:quinohemoprotein amine dehydrogenase
LPSFAFVLIRAVMWVSALMLPFGIRTQQPVPVVPVPHPPVAAPQAASQAPAAATPAEAATAQDPVQDPPQDPPQDPAGNAEKTEKKDDKQPPRRGIAIDDMLVHTHCSKCHVLDARQLMTRISYVRKSPEGWAETIKRMIRLHGLQVSPGDAKQLVRSLANSNGLARSEAERGLYESERRVHWSEEQQDQDFRRACAECHPLGRVLLQQRDPEEWQLLRATHVAMFPLARGQMGGGPPEEQSRRGGGGPPRGAASTRGRGTGGGGGTGSSGDGNQTGPTQSVGDRVLAKLSDDQPLFSPAWEKWTKNRREVPLAGLWTVTGHETGRGDLSGTIELKRTDADEYDTIWNLSFTDGTSIRREGKGLLYAGYSWRGRSTDPAANGGTQWREVLLLDDAWQSLRGRMFTGAYDEIGCDVTLHRDQGRPRVLALGNAAVQVPSTGHVLTVHGESFPPTIGSADLFVGQGITVTGIERRSDRELRVTLDVAAGTELGPRTVAYGTEPGTAVLQLYDTVDYVRITPLQGFARVGGARMPKQLERFEAFAVHRGPDGKPYTEDDIDLFQVRPRWGLEEFRVYENDDDVLYVGAIDATTGVFTPNVDGPNPKRRWSTNNVGDVFVTAEIELDVAVRPPEPKPAPKEKDAPKEGDPQPAAVPVQPASTVAQGPLPRERKTFRARGHLVVTVPLYTRWLSLDWEDR